MHSPRCFWGRLPNSPLRLPRDERKSHNGRGCQLATLRHIADWTRRGGRPARSL